LENPTKNTTTIEQPRSSMEMSTANPLRIRSLRVTQIPVIAQMLCGLPLIANSKKPMSKARPTVSVVEEQERSVELVPAETGTQSIIRTVS
jgi:hypothetical protein